MLPIVVQWILKWYATYLAVATILLSFLALINIHIGLSNWYTKFLLLLFNWGREKVEIRSRTKSSPTASDEDEASDTDADCDESTKKEVRSNLWERLTTRSESSEKDLTVVLDDCIDWLRYGVESMIADDVTDKFRACELASWNLLTRTNRGYMFVSWRLNALWLLGFLFRYIFLVPVRLMLLIYGVMLLILGACFVHILPISNERKRRLDNYISSGAFRIIARFGQLVVTFHNRDNLAKPGGICVANHTSPYDLVVLAGDHNYAFVGQIEAGIGGIVQRMIAKNQDHVWFERAEKKDRERVAARLKSHVHDLSRNPILIFPEGVCSNNTSVLMFQKGSFEAADTIYPVAIKYDNRYCDVYFGQDSIISHMWSIVTSWCIKCDVYYLKPEFKAKGEDAISFASRAKCQIAFAGNFSDICWDGYTMLGKTGHLVEKAKLLYSERLIDMMAKEDSTAQPPDQDPEEITPEF